MSKDDIVEYYSGAISYTLFLQDVLHSETKNGYLLLDGNNVDSAMIGFISNIFLAIKENIIEKNDSNFNTLILTEMLEENVSMIATKEENGYKIDNYIFQDKETLVDELRNKIAHGNFKFDLKHNKIILCIEGNEIKINIIKLSNFVVSSLYSYLKNYNTNEFTRSLTVNNRVLSNRVKPILNKNELISYVKKFRQKIFTIKSKDGSNVPSQYIKKFEYIINCYIECHDMKTFYKDRINLEKEIGQDYEIIISDKPFNNVDYDSFVNYFLKIVKKDNLTLEEQTIMIACELERNENIENNKLNLLVNNLNNLIVLNTIKECNTVNINVVFNKILEKYGNMYFSTFTLVSSLIASFNSLFSYGKDNIYRNNNEYLEKKINGLDYSQLDLSLLNIEFCNVSKGYIKDLKLKKDSKYKGLEKIEDSINKINTSISNVSNNVSRVDVLKSLKRKLTNITNIRNKIKEEYDNLLNEYNECNKYFDDNINHFTNERIIDGIRNSIAHGNYYVKSNIDTDNSFIVFEDIYEGELTFKCNVRVKDFEKMMFDNAKIIYNYINSDKVKVLTK